MNASAVFKKLKRIVLKASPTEEFTQTKGMPMALLSPANVVI